MQQRPSPRRRRQKPLPDSKNPARSSGVIRFKAPAAGIDSGAAEHWVAVPAHRDAQPVRRCGPFPAALYAIAPWLEPCGSQPVGMDSTGVYWMPLFAVRETRGFEVTRVDAHPVKQGPGRTTAGQDGQWLQELHRDGVLRGAFRPDDEGCVLRSSLRQREGVIGDASRAIQPMQKALAQMHVQLTEGVSDRTGKTGMTISRAILAGAREAKKLATPRDPRGKQHQAPLAKALQGPWRQEPLFALAQAGAR